MVHSGELSDKITIHAQGLPQIIQQIGRVNFIENVRSGGNLLHDRPSFDLHGKNITIGKIARP